MCAKIAGRKMKRQVMAGMLALVLLAAACGTTQGEVTGKEYEPAHTAIEFFGCGLAFDGSYDCGSAKPKMVYHPDRWYVFTTDGRVRVGRGTYDGCDVGDWFDGDRCHDERPAE